MNDLLLSSSEESITSDDTDCMDENEDSDQPPINSAAVSIYGVFKTFNLFYNFINSIQCISLFIL